MQFITTNIRINRSAHRKLRYMAAERGRSMADLVREAVDEYLGGGDMGLSAGEFRSDPIFFALGPDQASPRIAAQGHWRPRRLAGRPRRPGRPTGGGDPAYDADAASDADPAGAAGPATLASPARPASAASPANPAAATTALVCVDSAGAAQFGGGAS